MQEQRFKKPEITNIRKITWNTIKTRWQFWVLLLFFATSLGAGFIFKRESFFPIIVNLSFITFFIIVSYGVTVRAKVMTSFWKQFAEINGWQYRYGGDPNKEKGLMFKQGDSRSITHTIEGIIENRQFRILTYLFSYGRGKDRKSYFYTVFAFKFNGSFPHIYLNSKHNTYGVSAGEAVPLPSEFEKKFTLSAPRKYETEALEIFTPDVLAALLDNDFPHDVEFVDQEVLIFTVGSINSFEQLEKEFNKALEIEDLLDEKLDKFKFEKIGDMPHTLN